MSKKIAAFQLTVANIPPAILATVGEDLNTHLTTIQSVVRIVRNKAGHGLSAKPPLREQVYVYLQLLVPFLGYVTRLRAAV
ncbi:MAG: hypothetical protein ABIR70_20775 [Bryobacteraceae bacterium]